LSQPPSFQTQTSWQISHQQKYQKNEVKYKVLFKMNLPTTVKKGGLPGGATGLFASAKALAPFLKVTMDNGVYDGKQYISK